MRTKKNNNLYRRGWLALIACFFLCGNINSQVVWENQQNEVFQYLYRMAQKGLVNFDDNIRPLSRIYISQCLDSLKIRSGTLSNIEKKELAFYRKEYSDLVATTITDTTDRAHFFSKDPSGRPRFIYYQGNGFLLRADPIITAGTIQGIGQHIKQYSSGLNLYGYAGKHFGYYFSFNDRNEDGTGLDTLRNFTPAAGFKPRVTANGKSQSYGELRGGVSYSWKTGSISFVQDQLLWGYGENGGVVLSSKSPTYPYIRLDYQPVKWLHFNYVHAWLNSDILDSARTYGTNTGGTYGSQRQIYVNKYMATHSIRVTPTKGLDISAGESVVYSDKLEAGYLIPLMFFKAYDNIVNNNNINSGSNGQFFFQISSRNHLRNTHMYGTLFIDEIKLGSVFDKVKQRNQLGYTLGASVTDVGIPYLTVGLEYTRINPFVYRNLLPAQNYTNSSYPLGDWMGNNADRWIGYLRYTPAARVKCLVRYQYVRKGGSGTYYQQYFQQPQPSFLFDLQQLQSEWECRVSYEWFNKLNLTGYYNSVNTDNRQTNAITSGNSLGLSLTYGL